MTANSCYKALTMIGFGEAGGILGADLAVQGCAVRGYDILLDRVDSRSPMLERMRAAEVQAASTLAEAIEGADLIVSAVTAVAAQDVARQTAATIRPGTLFLDINSVSPETKRVNAGLIDAAGGHYVEAAVMAPVPPQRLKVPMLLGGTHAESLAAKLRALGMNATAVSDEIGVASAIKMCRSIVIKGLEALAVESMLTARRYGAEDAVLASLHASFPGMGWDKQLPDYLLSRVAEHGRRRAAEMREVAATVEDVGIEPTMATAIARRHDALIDDMEAIDCRYRDVVPFSWRQFADRLDQRGKQGNPS